MRRPTLPSLVLAAFVAGLSANAGRGADAGVALDTATAPHAEKLAVPHQEGGMSAEQIADFEAWRTKRLDRLTAPDGWLTLVGLEWLGEGANRLGSAEDADVRFRTKTPSRLATLTRRGDELTLEPAAGVTLTIAGKPVVGSVPLVSDDKGDPTTVTVGSISFYVIRRGDRWAVRIKDSESPVRTGFRGLDYYPLAADWRITARFEPAAKGTTIPVPTILGSVEDSPSPGEVVFVRNGVEVRLEAIDEGDGRLFLVFGDSTNGKATYGGGRFVYADPPKPGATTVIVDFNQAYNPPCVFTPYATCPLPPKGNKMPFPVEAGEKLWSGYHHDGQ